MKCVIEYSFDGNGYRTVSSIVRSALQKQYYSSSYPLVPFLSFVIISAPNVNIAPNPSQSDAVFQTPW